ncbi:MAG: RraA family protein, partial [Chloroflexi bacterium]|nr:RraA family protein [Chloroflexota bacterium]
ELAACVIDGGVRDAAGVRELDYPTWSRAITPITGKFRIEAAEINGLIRLVDVQVAPGDLICADDTGICVVPAGSIEEVLNLSRQKDQAERKLTELIRAGGSIADIKQVLSPDKW